jgi:two-component system response regulator HupR/HoxA
MSTQPTILFVSKDRETLDSYRVLLSDEFDVKTATTAREASDTLHSDWVQVVICVDRLNDAACVEFLESVARHWPEVKRLALVHPSCREELAAVVERVELHQYLSAPPDELELRLALRNAATVFALAREKDILTLEKNLRPEPAIGPTRRGATPVARGAYSDDDGIVRGANSPMNAICDKLHQVASYDISVLLTGESGTGKELAAHALHVNSLRWEKPFEVNNCGALPDELLESELFGYKQGAFTGAVEDRIGLFERADGGTIFLDEIGEVSPAFQVKLLRVLQDGEIRPLGCAEARRVDVRIIAATNRDLEADVKAGRFREDLYYRLAAVTVHMPPLRERDGDLPVLAEALLSKAVDSLGKSVEGFTDEALSCMQEYAWPGNIRELQNEIQRMLVECQDTELGADLLSHRVLCETGVEEDDTIASIVQAGGSLKARIESLEARILKESLIRHRWNKSRAARELGLSRVGLRSKLERYGLEQTTSESAARKVAV